MNTSITIGPWDWRYRVGFDERLKQTLENSVNALESSVYRDLLLKQIELFSSFVSVSQLINHFIEEENASRDTAINLEGKVILFIPKFLEQEYLQTLEKSKNIESRLKKELALVINAGAKNGYYNYNIDIFRLIFGHYLSALLVHANDEYTDVFTEESIKSYDITSVTKEIISDIISNPPKQLKELIKYVPSFEIKFKDGQGFAEYWAKGMLGNNNELIVMINDDQLGYNNLKATIAHEILGHAIFYNLKDLLCPSFFDHGAFAFIEGWATWCEWNASDPLFARNLRSSRCRTLKLLDMLDPEYIQEQIAHEINRLGYSEEVAKTSIEYFFQYPGFGQSYTLGALWLEARFLEETPMLFFNNLKQLPWGDFFLLW